MHALTAVASLWSGESRRYVHADLAHEFGEALVHSSLSVLHSHVFGDWIGSPIRLQKMELEHFLRDPEQGHFAAPNVTAKSFHHCVPDMAAPAERLLFEGDMAVILLMLDADRRDGRRNASGPAASHWSVEAAIQRVKTGSTGATVSLKDLSVELAIAPNHLEQLFGNETGVSLRRYQLAIRMFKAANLMTETNSTVAEVAAILGYPDVPNFKRDFRSATGRSPGAYRREKVGATTLPAPVESLRSPS